ncbi:MAG: hypothetical protein LBU19_05155 [Treponema sp.]|jgi:hypothetical protein|nr:hypothetical protein [Treponema sp.]
MNLENVLEIIKPRPSFWLRVWLFFFLLINRKEGMRFIETLTAKVDELILKTETNKDLTEKLLQQYREDRPDVRLSG